MNKDKFFGRSQYLEILDKRVRGLKEGYRQNIAIFGDELVGKTTLVFKFLNGFYDPRVIILYLEIRPESFLSFARRFIGVLLYNFLSNSGLPLEEDLDYLLAKSAKFIPSTVIKIKALLAALEKRKKQNLFGDLLALCESIKAESGKSVVVVFDEFHNLEKCGINNLYGCWSRALVSQKNTLFIIISSLKEKGKSILAKNLSLLFGNFEQLVVEPFDVQASSEFLKQKFLSYSLPVNEPILNFLVHFTGGYPFYLKLVSEEYLKSSKASLVDALEALLFEPSGALNQRFSNYLKRFLDSSFSQDYISILHLVSKGHNKIKDVALYLHKPKSEALKRINSLVEFDCLVRSGDFIGLCDRVFSFWLKFVYQGKAGALTFDAKNQRGLFRENIAKDIEEFSCHCQKPLVERIQEVLRLFADETVQLEKKRFKLTHFREIKPLEFGRQSLKDGLIGRSADAVWVIAFKEDPLTEEDVAEFAKECRKYRDKLERKIIISPCTVELNARLRALEEKVVTWDFNHLNQLFDLFSKPRITSCV